MDKQINGYIKLIGREVSGDYYLFNVYIENDTNLYKIDVAYEKDAKTSSVKNFRSGISEITPEGIKNMTSYFVPHTVEEITIDTQAASGNLSPYGCTIGDIIEFNTNFVNIFADNMYPVSNTRINDIISLNKQNFVELVENIRELNVQTIDIDANDIFSQYERVELDDETFFYNQDLTGVRVRADKYNNKLNEFGNFAEYDVR